MKNKIKIKVVGHNVNRFIIKLNKKNINIYQVFKKNNDCCYLIIDYNFLDDVIKYKAMYDIEVIDYLGPIKIKKKIFKNIYFIISLLLALIIIFILTRLTFNIKIITNNQKLNKLLKDELKIYGIYKYAPLKNYQELTEIKKKILTKYKDTFEWLEIEKHGTEYIIRFEQRIENKKEDDTNVYDIVALKDSKIMELDVDSGQIIKNINQYVKKGDVIVSSDIKLNDEIKSQTSAKGNIYGEVWYKVIITIPNDYKEKKLSGRSINTYSLNFISFKILFNKSSFFDKIEMSKPIISNNIFPISFNKENIKEVVILKNNKKDLALKMGLDKIKKNLKDKEEIIDYIILNEKKDNDEYTLELFISVKEEIGDYLAR